MNPVEIQELVARLLEDQETMKVIIEKSKF
jgi:hypothetical protein